MADETTVVTIEEPGNAVEVGETYLGTIERTYIDEVPSEDGMAQYYHVEIDMDVEGWSMDASWPMNVKETTGLGQALERFGVRLEPGREIDLDNTFSPGTRVGFEVQEVEGDESTFTVIDEATLRPADSDPEPDAAPGTDGAAGNGDAPDDHKDRHGEVLEIASGFDGKDETELKKELASRDGELLAAYKELVEAGGIEVVDDTVIV